MQKIIFAIIFVSMCIGLHSQELDLQIDGGKTFNEYIQDYPFLAATGLNTLADLRQRNSGIVIYYDFQPNTRVIQGIRISINRRDSQDLFTSQLTELIRDGHNLIDMPDIENMVTILVETPMQVNETFDLLFILQFDNVKRILWLNYFFQYK